MCPPGSLLASTTPAQAVGEQLFGQGCDAFDLVEGIGSFFTPLGQKGRWLVRNLEDDTELVYAFETIDLVPPPPENPAVIKGTTFVAWKFEHTGIQGTNRTDFQVTAVDELFNAVAFFQGETFRGTHHKSGGISGTAAGNVAAGRFAYDAVRIILCKKGLGGGNGPD